MTSITFALLTSDSLALWEEGASEVVIAETDGGVGEKMVQLAGFQFFLSGDPSQRSLLRPSGLGVDCKVVQQRTSPQVARALELPDNFLLSQQ